MTGPVAVLMGGWSSEREVSLTSGAEVVKALANAGHDVRPIRVERRLDELLRQLEPRPAVVFNALHGRYGEDGCVQGILECLGIPYTHSGVLASALAMDKPAAKDLFAAAGIPCPAHRILVRDEYRCADLEPLPVVVKPANEGSSVGVRIVRAPGDMRDADAGDWPFGDRIMVEEFVPGRELTVCVMGDRALGVTEIRPRTGFYDYAAKYTAGGSDHLLPAPVHDEIYQAAMDHAVRAHRVLGCRGVSRADFRYDDTGGEPGRLYLLEVNTQPGMTPLSLVPEAAAHAGIGFEELVCWMVEHAACDA